MRQPRDFPQTLNNRPFYDIDLDEEQKQFRDAIWNPKTEIVFCNAVSGAGKTLVSVGTACLMYHYGRYDGILYIVSAACETRQGYLPGTIEEKSEVYFSPLYQALASCKEMPEKVVMQERNIKSGTGFVEAITETFLRGQNIENKLVIIDEAQNFNESNLRKTLTRLCPTSKAVVIGHTGQIDLANPSMSSFERCMKHFARKGDERVEICKLTHNYRGFVSKTADEPWL